MDEPWVVIYVAANDAVADMIVDFLAAEGITAMTRSVGLPPAIVPGLGVEILVSAEVEEEARRALDAFLEGMPESWPDEGEPGPQPDEDRRGGEPKTK